MKWFLVSLVVLLSFLDTCRAQCTSSKCIANNAEDAPPHWENGAVYFHSLLQEATQIFTRELENNRKQMETYIEERLSNFENGNRQLFEQKLDATTTRLEGLLASLENDNRQLFEQMLGAETTRLEGRLASLENKLEGGIADVSASCKDSSVTFLRRQDGSVNFTRSWSEYRDGFGDPAGEFWLGLTALYRLTSELRYRLRVDLLDWSGERKWAEYGDFAVGSENENFKLSISGYDLSSTAGDSMTGSHSLNGMAFSTYDRGNDMDSGDCAAQWKGGWWYRACHQANPTGLYKPAEYRHPDGISWYTAYGDWRSFEALTLKLVPV